MHRTVACLAVWLLATALGGAQPPPAAAPPGGAEPETPPPVSTAAPPVAVIEASGSDAASAPAREQSIYLPYRKLWEVFEKEGRGVFLPYEQFRELWNAQLDRAPAEEDDAPPVGARIADIQGVARVGDDVVTFDATISFELLARGWHEIPLRLHDASVMEATLDDAPARLRFVDGEGYRLLARNEGDEPLMKSLTLRFAAPYRKQAGLNSVLFHGPIAPVSKWDLRIPEPDVEVMTIHPLLAAAEVSESSHPDETRVLAFVGAAPQVQFSWKPEAEGAMGLGAVASVRTEQRIRIREGVTRTQVQFTYSISRTKLSSLSVEVPAGQKVVGVFDANVKQWTVEDTDTGQRIDVQLFEPVEGTQPLRVDLEQYGEAERFLVPVVRAVDVGRQQGIIAVGLSGGLRAEVTDRRGLLQLDAADLPSSLASENPVFAYRYLAAPYTLELSLEKIQPRVSVETLVESHLGPEEMLLDVHAVYDVQRAGVFDLDLLLPDDYEVRSVQGVAHGPVTAAQVDRHFVSDEAASPRRLHVTLTGKAEGPTGLALQLRRALQEADLLAPTGKAVDIPIGIPRATGEFLERETGRLVVYAPESLSINPRDSRGLRPIAYRDAIADMQRAGATGNERPVLSFAYGNDETSLALTAERRAPYVTARQLLSAGVESGVIKYGASLIYDIRYSPVEVLRVDVPAEHAESIRLTTPGLRRDQREDAEVEAGYVAWQIAGETEFFGEVRVEFQWEDTIGRLDIGQSVTVDIPRIVPRDTDRAWGQVVISKAEAIDVVPAERRSGLRTIDPRYDLMPGAGVAEGAMAFEFHDAWGLSVEATRYETKEVTATSVERGLVRAVLTRGKVTNVQALFRVVSARQRLVVELPPDTTFDSQPLRLNGRPVALEKGDGQQYFIPLVGIDQGEPFLLELRYAHPQKGHALRVPQFPQEPAVQQVFFSVHLPRNLVFLGARGPWDSELVWRLRGFNLKPQPDARRTDPRLLKWVAEGLAADQEALNSFPTDGDALCFSTLRPPAGRAGALDLRVTSRWLLHLIVLVIIIGIGIRHLSTPLVKRAVVVGSWLVALIVLSVFMPSLVRSLVSNAAMAAGATVLIVWALWYLLFILPKSPVADAYRNIVELNRAATEVEAKEPEPEEKEDE